MRAKLRAVFDEVLNRLDIQRAMQAKHVIEQLRSCAKRPLLVIAFGKAARAMAMAMAAAIPKARLRGLVVPPEPDDAPLPPFEVIPGGHPLPTNGSLQAARRALELARSVSKEEDVVFLVSGGGSAMLEMPADEHVSVDALRELNQALIGSGADIDQINVVRRHLSAIKGGRLAMAAAAASHQLTLAISDVPDSSPAASLASGPTMPDSTTLADCRSVLDQHQLWQVVPQILRTRLEQDDLPRPMLPDHTIAKRSNFVTILGEGDARMAACEGMRSAGYVVEPDGGVDNWHYEQAADHLLNRLEDLHQKHPGKPVAIVTTGELSVPLPDHPGTGGRNLQFALYCATRITSQPITVLSCGSDGIDGNSHAAGAIVDATTMKRAEALGYDVHNHLDRCDAFPLLHAIEDSVMTGPTGTNVRDLRILVREA